MIESTIRISRPLVGVALLDPAEPLSSGGDRASPTVGDHAPHDTHQRAGLAEERAAVEAVVASIAEAARELESHRRKLLAELQHVAVELAVAIASRLIYDKIQANDYAVESLVREVVERLGAKGPVVVRMHPEDVSLLRQRLGGQSLGSAELRLVEDSAVSRGDCKAEAGEVSVVSQLDAQLNDIRRHLLRSLADAQVERRKAAPPDHGLRRFPDRRQTA
jgi:flagellar assembly protein FliH